MKKTNWLVLVCLVSFFPASAFAEGWGSLCTADQLAGGTFEVQFAGGAVATAVIVDDGGGAASATIPAGNVVLTVTGDTWSAVWRVTNTSPNVIDRVRVYLDPEAPNAGSDCRIDNSRPPAPGDTPNSARGRLIGPGAFPVGSYDRVNSNLGLAPLAAVAPAGLPPKNLGDLWDDVTFIFNPGRFPRGDAAATVFAFRLDADPPVDTAIDCAVDEPCDLPSCDSCLDWGVGACCSADGCVEVTEAECIDIGQKHRGVGTTCAEECPNPIPAVSEWGLAVMALLVLAAGTVVVMRRRLAVRHA